MFNNSIQTKNLNKFLETKKRWNKDWIWFDRINEYWILVKPFSLESKRKWLQKIYVIFRKNW